MEERQILTLRPYQQAAVDAVFSRWEAGARRCLIVLPTGTGKTIVFAAVAERLAAQGKRVLILAHRDELLQQAADKLRRATGLGCSVEKAEQRSTEGDSRWFAVTVGSVQTLRRKRRQERLGRGRFDAIIVDEAHHIMSDEYQRVLSGFDAPLLLGVTATPERSDKKTLLQTFPDGITYSYTLADAVRDGWLCRITVETAPIRIDLRAVRQQHGDFEGGSLDQALTPHLPAIAEEIRRSCAGRRTVVFLPLIRTAQALAKQLGALGLRAAEVHGSSTDRAQILKDFDAGAYDVLCNAMLLTEGWDCPGVSAIVVLRATRSRSLYMQMIGRGTRPAEGKQDLRILDFQWLCEKYDLCRPAELLPVEEEAKKRGDGLQDLDALAAEREKPDPTAAVRKRIEQHARRQKEIFDPLARALGMESGAGAPDEKAPTERMRSALVTFGVKEKEAAELGYRQTRALLDRLFERKTRGLASLRQVRLLERYGFPRPEEWTGDEAGRVMGALASTGWRWLPAGKDSLTPERLKGGKEIGS